MNWNTYVPPKADDAVLLMHEVEPDWSYDLKDPGKNFWYECPLCCQGYRLGGCRSGRNNSALCEKCWVWCQGYFWFVPYNPKPRPLPPGIENQ